MLRIIANQSLRVGLFTKLTCRSYATAAPIVNAGGSSHYQQEYERSMRDPNGFWGQHGREKITWSKPFGKVSDCNLREGRIAWFVDGELNAAENCIDRHLKTKAHQTAIIWEQDEPGKSTAITYQELHDHVCQLANVLKAEGVRKGDVVTIYMPMIPVAVYAMLACARIGATHSVVFAGFSADALKSRIHDASSTLVITADFGLRGGKHIPLKETVDTAVDAVPSVKRVLVAQHTKSKVHMKPSRDVFLEPLMAKASKKCDPVPMNSEAPLFYLYTSGSTGQPKGLVHTHGGYLVNAALSHQVIFDYKPGEVYACTADIGWITGHTYLVYGPLLNGATTVLFESTPTHPNASRLWEMVERLKVNQLYTAPTAIRALMKHGKDPILKHDRSSLRVLGSVGEPINADAWNFYNDVIGGKRCTVVDTWWQTETGGVMLTPLPGDKDLQPGCATRPFFGVEPVILTDKGEEVIGEGVGNLCLKRAPPSMARTIAKSHPRYLETYFLVYPGYYFSGDGARRDSKGHLWITGRVDDVINVSGHRLGTAEIETALSQHPGIVEAAVVGFPHEIKGEGIFAFVIPRHSDVDEATLVKELKASVRKTIGGFAIPDAIIVCHGLPKTRSGKIMRRILRKLATGKFDDLGDLSTLAEPHVVDTLIESVKSSSKHNHHPHKP